MAEQYTGHVSPPVSRDHFTALSLVEFLVKQYGRPFKDVSIILSITSLTKYIKGTVSVI